MMDGARWNLGPEAVSPRRRSMPCRPMSAFHHQPSHRAVSQLSTIDDSLLDFGALSIDESPDRNKQLTRVPTNVWSSKPKPVLSVGFSEHTEQNTSLTEKFHHKRRSLQPRRCGSDGNLAQKLGNHSTCSNGNSLFSLSNTDSVFNRSNSLFRPSPLAAQVAALKSTDTTNEVELCGSQSIHHKIANPDAANCFRKRSRPDSGDSTDSEAEESMEMEFGQYSTSDKNEQVSSSKTNRISSKKCKQGFCTRVIQWCHILLMCLVVLGGVLLAGGEIRRQWCQHQRHMNVTKLYHDLNAQVFGQHIAINVISNILQDYFDPEASQNTQGGSTNPGRSLVLSLQGWTGVGKNFVSSIIASQVHTVGVQKIIVPLHFPHPEPKSVLEEQLKHWIVTNISHCAVNIFIIDEVDKGPSNFLDALHTTLQFLHSLSLEDTKVIILLLSNSGAVEINKLVYQHYVSGYPREDLSHDMFLQDLLEASSDKDHWFQDFYNQNLVSHLVPFLPLEKRHVQQCIMSDLQAKSWDISESLVHQVAQELSYFPSNAPIFSKTGCRKVTSKVDLIVN